MTMTALSPARTAAARWLRFVFFVVALLGLGPIASAAAISASASTSQDTMVLGDSIAFTVTVQGSGNISVPREVEVDGLSIRYTQRSQRAEYVNGRGSMSTVLSYTVEAERVGKFTIPAVELEADGKRFRTEPIGLTVEPPGAGGNKSSGINAVGFAEISPLKKSAFVGEMVPIEMRLFIDARVRWQAEQMPAFEGDGFTKQKMPEPRREHARRDGKDYEVVVFRTAITPSRAGKITLGPIDIPYVAQIPQPRRNRGRSPFDDLLGDSLLDNPFFSDTPARRVTAKAAAVELEVKPLPAAGRPKDFSGAIGEFKFTAEGTPKTVKVGDPLTMKLSISGRGNFDRVNTPPIQEPDGWHPYPASGDFKADDDLGISGTKTFEVAVIPETRKSAMPVFAFSYFDPTAGKYITLTNAPAPLEVVGGAPPPEATARESSTGAAPAAGMPPPKPVVVNDILGLRYDLGERRDSFQPHYLSSNFAIMALTPAVLILGFAVLRSRQKDASAAKIGRWQKEKAESWRVLRRERDRGAFLEAAVHFLEAETALKVRHDEHVLSATTVRDAAAIDDETAAAIDEILAARAELLYAGTARSEATLAETDRARMTAALERFERCPPRC